MQEVHQPAATARTLLSARQVQELLQIDRSTVYRMAEDGRLPSIKVGKQWRFPADRILALLDDPEPARQAAWAPGSDATPPVPRRPGPSPARPDEATVPPPDPVVAQAAIDVASPLLGVMMVVTDIDGMPVTGVSNPCPWFAAHAADPEVVNACLAEWRDLADLADLQPRFELSAVGFECARAFIRSGSSLVGMVLAGGVAPAGTHLDGRYDLDAPQRERVLAALPQIAASLTRSAPTPLSASKEIR